LPAVRVAVNVSTVELRHKDFVAGVRTILAETRLAPCYLELELTETVLMQDSRSTAAVLHSLKELGIQLALDDFGTGYSSLSHLKRFPIDALKIDHSFVRNLATNTEDAIIVGLVVNMGRLSTCASLQKAWKLRSSWQRCRDSPVPWGKGTFSTRQWMPTNSPAFWIVLAWRLARASATRSSRMNPIASRLDRAR
jgi:hypothetical protein